MGTLEQVAHGERDRQFANVYMSGADGRHYTLSLRRVVKVSPSLLPSLPPSLSRTRTRT